MSLSTLERVSRFVRDIPVRHWTQGLFCGTQSGRACIVMYIHHIKYKEGTILDCKIFLLASIYLISYGCFSCLLTKILVKINNVIIQYLLKMSTVIRISFVKNEILGNNFIDSLIIIIVQCSKLIERYHPIPFVSGKNQCCCPEVRESNQPNY